MRSPAGWPRGLAGGRGRPRRTERGAESEESARLLFERNPKPIMVYERGTLRFVAVSDGAVARYGYSRAEFLEMTVTDLAPPEDRALQAAFFASTEAVQRPGRLTARQWRHRCRDGETVETDITSDDLDLGGGGCRILVCQTRSERDAVEDLLVAREQLHSSEERYRVLFEHNPQPMVVYDRETLQIIAVSDAMVAAYGYSRDEFLRMTIADLRPPEEVERLLAYLATDPRGQRPDDLGGPALPGHHRYSDGTLIEVEVTSDNVTVAGRACRIALYHNVTQRNRAVADLAAARDQALEASNAKSALLANVSHEIRTPMSGVIGMTELLLDMGLTDEQREFAEHVARSGQQTLAIVNDLLDLAKIEKGHLELESEVFDLHAAIRETCAATSAPALAKGLRIEVDVHADVPARVVGDGRRLRQVLFNLLNNAVKFTAAGAVRVRATAPAADGGLVALRVEVTDTGIGIDPSDLERLFEPFTQADQSTARLYGGTGLGLAISRELIELMGGTLTARSAPGQGSTFTLELRLAAAPTARAAQAPGAAPPSAAGWTRQPVVLVAEDNEVNQVVAARALERHGYRVRIVGNGQEALDALDAEHFDAVLMDCQMPVLDGYQATIEQRRREQADSRHTPIIAMTAHALAGDRERCTDAGMDDYLAKPIRAAELDRILRQWIPDDPTAPAAS